MNEPSDAYLPLSPTDLLLLLSLVSGESYGYRIVQELRRRSEGRIDMLPGNLYSVLQRLVRNGLVERAGRRTAGDRGGAPRNYFRITGLGREVVAAEATRLKHLLEANDVQALLSEVSS